jgi:putative restriction endonuclease
LSPGKYVASWPVFVVADDPVALRVRVLVDDHRMIDMSAAWGAVDAREDARRAYVTRQLQVRLHQQQFRERVLAAYRAQCAFCRLRHEELLDAAHIIADSEARGDPVIGNGLALCKLHHAAFDRHFLTVRPDYRIEVSARILGEEDGPMLLHGLQELNQKVIHLPVLRSHRPDRDRLEERYRLFKRA